IRPVVELACVRRSRATAGTIDYPIQVAIDREQRRRRRIIGTAVNSHIRSEAWGKAESINACPSTSVSAGNIRCADRVEKREVRRSAAVYDANHFPATARILVHDW